MKVVQLNPSQEVALGCFEQEEEDEFLTSSTSTTQVITWPVGFHANAKQLEQKKRPNTGVHSAIGRECSASGRFCFKSERLRDRLICWRVCRRVLVLREIGLHESLTDNAVRLQFPVNILPTGVNVFEGWNRQSICVCVVTIAGTVHRFWYSVPHETESPSMTRSVFAKPNDALGNSKTFRPTTFTSSSSHALTLLSDEENISHCLWQNEYNLVIGTDLGRVLGVNAGLPNLDPASSLLQEFVFSDESVVKWIWTGLVKSSLWTAGTDESLAERKKHHAILAMASMTLDTAAEDADVYFLTLSADLTLRVWSFRGRHCTGTQSLRGLLRQEQLQAEDDEEVDEIDDDMEMDSEDAGDHLISAHMRVLPGAPNERCRFVLYTEMDVKHPHAVFVLRGDLLAGKNLSFEVARTLTLGPNKNPKANSKRHVMNDEESALFQKKNLRLVDFCIEQNHLFSAWKRASSLQDFIFVHANALGRTGPRVVQAQQVSSLSDSLRQYEIEDESLLVAQENDEQEDEEARMETVDAFFVRRLFVVGRFSRGNLYRALLELLPDLQNEMDFQNHFKQLNLHCGNVVVRAVNTKWLQTVTSAAEFHNLSAVTIRVNIWKRLLQLCSKHWRVENVLVGLASSSSNLFPGTPVVFRRNRVAIVLPSAPAVASKLFTSLNLSSADVIEALYHDILPIFSQFASWNLQQRLEQELRTEDSTAAGGENSDDTLTDLALHAIRQGVKPTAKHGELSCEMKLTRAMFQLSKLLTGEGAAQILVMNELLQSLLPVRKHEPLVSEHTADVSMDHDENETMTTPNTLGSELFGGREIAYAFAQVTSSLASEMCQRSLWSVLFFSYLVETRASFLTANALGHVQSVCLGRAIQIHRQWALAKHLCSQTVDRATVADKECANALAMTELSLLHRFVMDSNGQFIRSVEFQKALSASCGGGVLDMNHSQTGSSMKMKRKRSFDDTCSVLVKYATQLVLGLCVPSASLLKFLTARRQFALMRNLHAFCGLDSFENGGGTCADIEEEARASCLVMHHIASCMLHEGKKYARQDDQERAHWCFAQALSYLCSAYRERNRIEAVQQTVATLKEAIPRAFGAYVLKYLWHVTTHISRQSHAEVSTKSYSEFETFVWVNIFKHSLDLCKFHDSHQALMHIYEVERQRLQQQQQQQATAVFLPSEDNASHHKTSFECVGHLIKELCRHRRLDLICEFQWGSVLEQEVERLVYWQAAHASVLEKDGSLRAVGLLYYRLLYAFHCKKNQFANAAAAMYSLSLRLKYARSIETRSLRIKCTAERDALICAANALGHLTNHNRWIVRKYHSEELASAKTSKASALTVVSLQQIEKEIVLLDGKVELLTLGFVKNTMMLDGLDAAETLSLLVGAVRFCDESSGTNEEKYLESVRLMEFAVAIATQWAIPLGNLTKSLARYCASTTRPDKANSKAKNRKLHKTQSWRVLETFLVALEQDDAKEQFEIVAAALLEWQVTVSLPPWLVDGLKARNKSIALLRLYLKNGLLVDALEVAQEMLPDSLLMANESEFQQLAAADSHHVVPWMPYNLFDVLLDTCEQFLGDQEQSSAQDAEVVQRVQQALALFRAKLEAFFRQTNKLDQAHFVALTARDANAKSQQ